MVHLSCLVSGLQLATPVLTGRAARGGKGGRKGGAGWYLQYGLPLWRSSASSLLVLPACGTACEWDSSLTLCLVCFRLLSFLLILPVSPPGLTLLPP